MSSERGKEYAGGNYSCKEKREKPSRKKESGSRSEEGRLFSSIVDEAESRSGEEKISFYSGRGIQLRGEGMPLVNWKGDFSLQRRDPLKRKESFLYLLSAWGGHGARPFLRLGGGRRRGGR